MSDIENNNNLSYFPSEGDYSGSDGGASIHNIHQINLSPLFSVNNVDASIFEEGDDENWYSIGDSNSDIAFEINMMKYVLMIHQTPHTATYLMMKLIAYMKMQ